MFTVEQESQLVKYLARASDIYFGLTPFEVRKLAKQYAVKLNLKIPNNWEANDCAGRDWFTGFLKRHPTLSIRTPQATSLARATSFNPHNVKMFFDNLSNVIERFNLSPTDIWNMGMFSRPSSSINYQVHFQLILLIISF